MVAVELPDPVALRVRLVRGLILGDQDLPGIRLGRDDGLFQPKVQCDPPDQPAVGVVLQEVGLSEVAANAVLGVPMVAAFGCHDPDPVICGCSEDAPAIGRDQLQRAEP